MNKYNRIVITLGICLACTLIVTRPYAQTSPFLLSVKWSPNGQMLTSLRSDNHVMVWNLQGSVILDKIFTEPSARIEWAPDSSRIAVQENNTREIMIVNVSNSSTPVGTVLARFPNPDQGEIAWSPNGQYIVSARLTATTLRVWQVNNTLDTFTELPSTFIGETRQIEWSPNGQKFAFTNSGNVRYITTTDFTNQLIAVPNFVYEMAWSPNSRYLAVQTLNDDTLAIKIAVHDMLAPRPILGAGAPVAWILDTEATRLQARDLEWSPDSTRMASLVELNGVQTVQVFNANNGVILERYPLNTTTVTSESLSWSPDGTRLAYPNVVNGVSQFVIVTPPPVPTRTNTAPASSTSSLVSAICSFNN